MDPATGSIAAAGISALANIGGGMMSAQGAERANAQNAMLNQQNINYQMDANQQTRDFQNQVNVANWAYQDKVNQQNFDFAREQTNASQGFAREQMAFQKDMSSTAYQRAMADMRAAGLNPILAYQQGGASTPSGAMGSAQSASAQGSSGSGFTAVAPKASLAMQNTETEKGRAIGKMASSALDAANSVTAIDNAQKTGKVIDADKTLREQQGQHEGQRMEKTIQETYTEKERNKLIREQQDLTKAQKKAADASSAASYSRAGLDAETTRQYGRNGMPGYGLGERVVRSLNDIPGPKFEMPNF